MVGRPTTLATGTDLRYLIGMELQFTSRKVVTLREAVEQYSAESRQYVNAYDWYRQSAQRTGSVPIGNVEVPTFKLGNAWYVNAPDLEAAIQSHRDRVASIKQVTDDFGRGVLHGKDGDTAELEDGGYRLRGTFHFAWSSYEIGRKRSNGSWYCSTCMKAAETEWNNPECHRCSDWGDCGRDCRLSRVYCASCGTGFDVPGPLAVDTDEPQTSDAG
jgi:hypothetical protein